MIHTPAIAVYLLDTVSQAPVIVQCSQSAPEPEWKSWLGVLAPWVGPLLSGVVSIYIAWRVFKWQGSKDRKQWLLDQKKAEWSRLLNGLYECSMFDQIPLSQNDMKQRLQPIVALNLEKIENVYRLLRISIFIDLPVLGTIQCQLSELVKSEIHYAENPEASDTTQSKWANVIWLSSPKYVQFVETVCATAREDIGA